MNDSFGGGFASSQGTGGGGGGEVKQGIAPLVIRQILDSSADGIKIYNFNYSIVKVVAILREIEKTSTRIIYRLQDHTGRMDAHLWLEEDSSDTTDPKIKVNRYVTIFGSIRNHNGTKAIMIFKIAPVLTPNEVNTHLLEVLNTRYSAEEFSRKSNGLDGMEGNGFEMGQTSSSKNDKGGYCGLTGKQLEVYNIVKAGIDAEGTSLQEIQKKLKKYSNQEIVELTDNMVLDGHIYTSFDTVHFLCTEP